MHPVFHKYTRDWLHEVTGYSKGYLSRVARGNISLSRYFVERVCFKLNRPQKELFRSAFIAASADGDGTIEPSGDVVVDYGASQEFTITPDTGYEIADVVVDGVSVGAVGSYLFENVVANHAISASFCNETSEP